MRAQAEWGGCETWRKQTAFEVRYFMTCCIHWRLRGGELMKDEKCQRFPLCASKNMCGKNEHM